jgi:hypothetical protein
MPCIHCSKEISNKGSLKAHEMSCRDNPNRVKHEHSPLAGKKKGSAAWNKGKKVGRLQHWDEKYPDYVIFTENSSYSRHSLKDRILQRNLIEYRCECCKIGPEWMGKPMPLILDHINGINNDNRLENLRFVCSNCDTQLETYKSKNRKKSGVY